MTQWYSQSIRLYHVHSQVKAMHYLPFILGIERSAIKLPHPTPCTQDHMAIQILQNIPRDLPAFLKAARDCLEVWYLVHNSSRLWRDADELLLTGRRDDSEYLDPPSLLYSPAYIYNA